MKTTLPFLVAALAGATYAQDTPKAPETSPAASVSATAVATTITVDYHRPGVKGRKVFGDLVPYGKLWRLGANEATTISFSSPVTIDGKKVDAGKYALFAIPEEDAWTFVLNSKSEQWGAYQADAKQDVLKFEAKPEPSASATEWMTFSLDPVKPDTASIRMSWDKLTIAFPVQVDVEKSLEAYVASAKGSPDACYKAADFALTANTAIPKALEWADKAYQAQASPFTMSLKARVLAKTGKKDEAIALMTKAIEMVKADKKMPADALKMLERYMTEVKGSPKS